MSENKKEPAKEPAKEAAGQVGKTAATAIATSMGGPAVGAVAGEVGKVVAENAADKVSEATKANPKPSGKQDKDKDKEKEEKSSKSGWVEDLTAIQKKADENAKALGAEIMGAASDAYTKIKNFIKGPGTPTKQLTSFSSESLDSLPKPSMKPSAGSTPGPELDNTTTPKLK